MMQWWFLNSDIWEHSVWLCFWQDIPPISFQPAISFCDLQIVGHTLDLVKRL